MAEPTTQLSHAARQRMDTLLPSLLGEVRARRHRRRARRAATVAALVIAPLGAWWLHASSSAPSRQPPADVIASSGVVIVATDPTILARCTVATVDRSEWYVGDDELQALLRADDRDAGLVRIGDHVLVSSSAIDPWPGDRLPAP